LRLKPLEITGLEFGRFSEITPLNHRFIPGHPRLKLTVDLDLAARAPGATPARFLALLGALLPTLRRHTCCGHGRIEESFPGGASGSACAAAEPDDAVDVAHLLEHLIIDFQHGVADMRSCSGVTCGLRTPITRYDLFIETPDEQVGRFSVMLACELMNHMLRGNEPSPSWTAALRLARRFFLAAADGLSGARACGSPGGNEEDGDALRRLLAHGFVKEIPMAINYSGVPLYRFNAIEDNLIDKRS